VAQALQFGYPGVPCIYYGDEVGLEGGNDPDNRRCFDWSGASWRGGILERVQQFAAWRRDRAELREGACLTLAHGDDWIAFARVNATAVTLLVANRGDAAEAVVPLDALPFDIAHWVAPSGHRWALEGRAIRLVLPARDAAWLFSA
jgi:alpha-glucosidase